MQLIRRPNQHTHSQIGTYVPSLVLLSLPGKNLHFFPLRQQLSSDDRLLFNQTSDLLLLFLLLLLSSEEHSWIMNGQTVLTDKQQHQFLLVRHQNYFNLRHCAHLNGKWLLLPVDKSSSHVAVTVALACQPQMIMVHQLDDTGQPEGTN